MAEDPKISKEIADNIAKALKSEEARLDIAEKLRNLGKKTVEELKEQLKIEEWRYGILEKKQELLESELIQAQQKISIKEEELEAEEQSINNRIEIAKHDLESGLITEQHFRVFQKIRDSELEAFQKKKKDTLDQIKNEKELLELRKESLEAIENMEESTENLVGTITGIGPEWKKTFVGQIVVASREAGGFGMALTNIGKGIKKSVTPANVLGSSLMKMQEATIHLAKEQDEAVSQFNKATGAAGQYDKAIVNLGHDHLDLGIDTQDASEAFLQLKEQFTDFTTLNKETQKELATLTATMNEFGVSSASTAESVQIMTKSMGMSVSESMIAQREIAATADELGVTPGRMAEEFAKAGSRLAAFGKQGVEVFKGLMTQAKATGLEIDRLIGIAEGFDTFESAAENVGKLNAVLGGPFLDSMEMIHTTDPTERIKLLRGAIEESGKSFQDMSYYQRKAIADAAGLSDVNELAKLMSGSLTETAAAAEADALSKEKMAEMASKAQSIMEKLTNSVHAFAIAIEPVINFVRWLLDGFLAFNKAVGGVLIPVLVGALGGFMLLNKAMQAGKAISAGYAAVIGLFTTAKAAETAAVTSGTMAEGANTTVKLANNAATNAGILATIRGNTAKAASFVWDKIIYIWTLLKTKASWSFAAAKTAETAAEKKSIPVKKASTAVSIAAVGPMLALGAAVLMIGGGIFLVAYGFSLLADSIKGMGIGEMIFLAAILVGIAVGLYFLIPALMAFAGASAVAVLPLLALGAAFLLIGGGVLLAAYGISLIIKSISGAVSSISEMASAIWGIGQALGEMPILKAVTFAFVMEDIAEAGRDLEGLTKASIGLKELTAASVELKPTHVQNVEKLVDQADRYIEAREESRGFIFDPLIKLIETATTAPTPAPAAGGGGGERTIILQVGDHQLKKFVLNVLNEQANPRKI